MTRAQILAASAAIAAALATAALWPSSSDSCREIEIALASDAGLVYALATVRGPAPDAGSEIPGAVTILDVREIACPEGSEPMSLAVEPIAWPCACRRVSDTGGACEADLGDGWAPAPMGRYLPAGQWRGECARTPCSEIAGTPAFNQECQ